MLLVTLLNHCYKFRSFVYRTIFLENGPDQKPRIIVEVVPRRTGKRRCPICIYPVNPS